MKFCFCGILKTWSIASLISIHDAELADDRNKVDSKIDPCLAWFFPNIRCSILLPCSILPRLTIISYQCLNIKQTMLETQKFTVLFFNLCATHQCSESIIGLGWQWGWIKMSLELVLVKGIMETGHFLKTGITHEWSYCFTGSVCVCVENMLRWMHCSDEG